MIVYVLGKKGMNVFLDRKYIGTIMLVDEDKYQFWVDGKEKDAGKKYNNETILRMTLKYMYEIKEKSDDKH